MLSKIITLTIHYLVQALYSTYTYRTVNVEVVEKLKNKDLGGHILAVWHQYVLSSIMGQTRFRHVAIVSRSKDADPVAYTLNSYGHYCVRGSSRRGNVDKGGKEAKEKMILELRKGTPGAVTVDGPKGPPKQVKPGIVDMAMQSGSPILPYIAFPESYWQFNSWDQFRLPKPFSRIVVFFGQPIYVEKDDSFEVIQTKLMNELNRIEQEAPSHFSQWKTLGQNLW
jgi:lysophospholipid acyltransferase (LPLAT)-like uncharacterized protein